jgi:hypothetical protein
VTATANALEPFAAETFDRAQLATAAAGQVLTLQIGAARVRVHFASAVLRATLAPAWGHLLTSDGEGEPADAELFAVSGEAAGPPPPPPWPSRAYRPRDEIAGFGSEPLEVAYQVFPGTLMLWNETTRQGVWWTRDVPSIPFWEIAIPLRSVMRWALRGRGLSLVHGAAAGDDRGYLLLAGVGGSGKSTTALGAPRAGLTYLADDHCAVDPKRLTAHPVTRFAKVTDHTLKLLPELVPLAAGQPRTSEGKTLVAMPFAAGLADRPAVLRGIVLPRVGAATSAPQPADERAAMAALAPSTLLQHPGSRPADQQLLGDVIRGLPAFTLTVGPDPDGVAAALSALLDELA